MRQNACILSHVNEMRLFDTDGNRLYLNAEERHKLLKIGVFYEITGIVINHIFRRRTQNRKN